MSEGVERVARLMALLFYHLASEVERSFGEEGLEAIKRGVENFGLERGRAIRQKVEEMGLEPNLENLSRHYDMPLKEAWRARRLELSPDRSSSEVDFCPFAQVWLEKGRPDLGLIYCSQDEALHRGYNPEISFENPKNVLRGDPCCALKASIPDGSEGRSS